MRNWIWVAAALLLAAFAFCVGRRTAATATRTDAVSQARPSRARSVREAARTNRVARTENAAPDAAGAVGAGDSPLTETERRRLVRARRLAAHAEKKARKTLEENPATRELADAVREIGGAGRRRHHRRHHHHGKSQGKAETE